MICRATVRKRRCDQGFSGRNEVVAFPMAQSLQGWLGSTCHSAENNAIFGQAQSFLSRKAPQTFSSVSRIDSKRYASTGGWGFGQFEDGEPATAATRRLLYLLPLPRSCAKSRRFGFHALRAVKAGRRR